MRIRARLLHLCNSSRTCLEGESIRSLLMQAYGSFVWCV